MAGIVEGARQSYCDCLDGGGAEPSSVWDCELGPLTVHGGAVAVGALTLRFKATISTSPVADERHQDFDLRSARSAGRLGSGATVQQSPWDCRRRNLAVLGGSYAASEFDVSDPPRAPRVTRDSWPRTCHQDRSSTIASFKQHSVRWGRVRSEQLRLIQNSRACRK